MLAVEGGACLRADIELAHDRAAVGVDGIQRVAGRHPDMRAVKADAVHGAHARKGAVFADYFCCCSFHDVILVAARLMRST